MPSPTYRLPARLEVGDRRREEEPDFQVDNHFGSDIVAKLYCSDQHGDPVGSAVSTSTISANDNLSVPIAGLMVGKKYVLRVKEAGEPDRSLVSACCLTNTTGA